MSDRCSPPPTILPSQERIIAIGDIHGDWKALISCLKVSKLIDKNLNWCAQPPSTKVIQLGDQLDRGGRNCPSDTDEASELKIFDYLDPSKGILSLIVLYKFCPSMITGKK